MPKTTTEKQLWTPAPKSHPFTNVNGFLGAVRKKLRPKFADLHSTVINSTNGKNKIAAMMNALRDTSGDKTFVDAFIDAGLVNRFGGDLERNKKCESKEKKHPKAIDFNMGEQTDGAANELRGCVIRDATHGHEYPWKPSDDLMIGLDWRVSDMRIFQLINEAKANKGPLADKVNKRMKTSSTSHGRVATFVVDYFSALVTAYDKQFPDGHGA